MSESSNAAVTREIIAAISAFDFDCVHQHVTDDLVVEQPYAALGQPERYEGREAFVEGLRLVPQMFKSFELTITRLFDLPHQNTVIFEQESDGVFHVDGSKYANTYVIIFEFDGGKVARWREYYNPEIMNAVMGEALAKMSNG